MKKCLKKHVGLFTFLTLSRDFRFQPPLEISIGMIGAYRGSCTRPHSLNSVQHVVCQLQVYRLFPVLGLGYKFNYDQKSTFSLSYYITYNLTGPEEFI